MKNSRITVLEAASMLAKSEISSTELCRHFIDKAASVEKDVHAFLSMDTDYVLKHAAESDKRRASGNMLSPYDGIPIAIKDNIAVKGQPCTCASKILGNFVSPYDSTVVERLKAAGLIPFGKTNMDEFAMGSSCENSAFAKTSNPWDYSRVPGGSSGGSAAAVSSGEVTSALGSDTGGSIRQPASFCGIVGMKPTYGRISRFGLVAFASSLDQIGPMTNSVDDAAVIFDLISGHDKKDSTSLPLPPANTATKISDRKDLAGVRLGIPREYLNVEGLDAGVKESFMKSLDVFRASGAEIVDVSLPNTRYAVATYYVIATAEASANLARFDGVRYGRRIESENLLETYLKTRGKGFGREVKRRIILGTFVLSSGYYDAYYLRAQKVRTLIRRDFETAFGVCDAILAPVSPVPAFSFNEKTSDPLQMYLADIYTISANLAGICAISVPADIDPKTKLPIGIQVAGPALGEEKILRISRVFESERPQKSFVPG